MGRMCSELNCRVRWVACVAPHGAFDHDWQRSHRLSGGLRSAVPSGLSERCSLRFFWHRGFDVYTDVLVHPIRGVLAHVLRLGTVSPQHVSRFVVSFFGFSVFEGLMEILVGHEDDDGSEWM